MSEPAEPLRETVLRQAQAVAPNPWYPKQYAAESATDLESLYGPLNDLRLANLVELTDWVPGKGQGYVLTPLGKEVLNDPVFLARLREGKPAVEPAPPADPVVAPQGATWFERGEEARRAFYESGPVWVVPALIVLNVVMFLVSIGVAAREGVGVGLFLRRGDAGVLHKLGALSAADLARGEWWRLLTSCFLHFGLLHIALNMTALFVLRRVESLWGSGRLLFLYLTCGICGSCAGIYYQPGDATTIVVLAGASGALWGLMTSEVGWLLINRSHLPAHDVRRWMQQLLFILLLNIGVGMLPGVSAAAHLGGGVAGFLAAFLLQVHRYGAPAKRALAGVQLALLPTLFLLGLAAAMEYDSRLQPFLIDEYRKQSEERLGKLGPGMDAVEPKADKLLQQDTSKRDPNEIGKVREELRSLVKKAKEAGEWLKRTSAGPAKPMRERGERLVETLVAYAEALDKQVGGEQVPDLDELRRNYHDARTAWTQVVAR
jgi:membrane associated rhomboid family serine protease